jgi:hypothetical protein
LHAYLAKNLRGTPVELPIRSSRIGSEATYTSKIGMNLKSNAIQIAR